MAFCSSCGARVGEDDMFCSECGAGLAAQGRKEKKNRKGARRKRKTGAIWVLLGTLFLAASAGATYFHLKSDPILLRSADDRSESSWVGEKSEKETKPEPVSGEDDQSEDTITADSSSIQKTISNTIDAVLGSDREVGEFENRGKGISSGSTDVEHPDQYHYAEKNCHQLYTDFFQQGAYAIEKELVAVTAVSEEEENELGRQVAKNIEKQFQGKLDIDKKWVQYVRELGENLATNVERTGIDYHFHVINEDKVNAFAIPGGGVYVFTGILDKIENEAQLAGVLGHEIKHVDLRHCIALYQFLSQLPQTPANSIVFAAAQAAKHPYNSRQEQDADRRGLELSYSFGYSPYQIVKFWEADSVPEKKEEKEGLFGIAVQIGAELENVLSTHPKADKRICLLKNHILRLQSTNPRKTVYVGRWNYRNRTTLFREQR